MLPGARPGHPEAQNAPEPAREAQNGVDSRSGILQTPKELVESPFPLRNQTWKETFCSWTRKPNSYPSIRAGLNDAPAPCVSLVSIEPTLDLRGNDGRMDGDFLERERPMTNVESAREFYPLGVSRPDLAVTDLPTPEEVFGVSRLGFRELVMFAIGPSLIALGISIGSGEWLLGPLSVGQFGFVGIGWVITASALFADLL